MGRGVEGSLLGLIEYEEPREPRPAPSPPMAAAEADATEPGQGLLGLVPYRRPENPRELPETSEPAPAEDDDLFRDLVVSVPRRQRSWYGLGKSVAAHVVTIGTILLVAILQPLEPPPDTPDYIRALIYDP
ncbi:MAG TPA: hypothetical protein VLC48_00190, partial [Gemmatimonadota bacterium]|nr:hypothetical protein [Gemmatimonadota bacterium]